MQAMKPAVAASGRLAVCVSVVDCLVTLPPPALSSRSSSLMSGRGGVQVLVNSANETLVGPQLAYFERGLPAAQQQPPKELGASNWGSLSAIDGSGRLLYPAQCMDGVVAIEGGAELRADCARIVDQSGGCKVGEAVATPARGRLEGRWHHIVHACAPFYHHRDDGPDPEWRRLLTNTYASALAAAFSLRATAVFLPLLGAGARGAPLNETCEVAALAVAGQLHVPAHDTEVHFGVRGDVDAAQRLVRALELAIDKQASDGPST